jgi:hypothetical protein
MATHAQIIPAQLQLSVGNATGIEELSDADVSSRAATYTCRTTGVFPVSGDCSSYYLCQLSPSGQLRAIKRTCYPNNYNPFLKICSSLFECPQPYECGANGFLCLTNISYAVCNPDNVPVRFELCEPGFLCNNKCNNPCTHHVLNC